MHGQRPRGRPGTPKATVDNKAIQARTTASTQGSPLLVAIRQPTRPQSRRFINRRRYSAKTSPQNHESPKRTADEYFHGASRCEAKNRRVTVSCSRRINSSPTGHPAQGRYVLTAQTRAPGIIPTSPDLTTQRSQIWSWFGSCSSTMTANLRLGTDPAILAEESQQIHIFHAGQAIGATEVKIVKRAIP